MAQVSQSATIPELPLEVQRVYIVYSETFVSEHQAGLAEASYADMHLVIHIEISAVHILNDLPAMID